MLKVHVYVYIYIKKEQVLSVQQSLVHACISFSDGTLAKSRELKQKRNFYPLKMLMVHF